MTVNTKKHSNGGSAVVPAQSADSSAGPHKAQYGLANISGLWANRDPKALYSRQLYGLPGIISEVSSQLVGAKDLRQPAESDVNLSKSGNASGVTKSKGKHGKSAGSKATKKIALTPKQKVKAAVENYFSAFGAPEAERKKVKLDVLELMINHGSEFIDLPVKTGPNKTYIKTPEQTLIEGVLRMSQLGEDYDFADMKIRREAHHFSIQKLSMFEGRAEFWGLVKPDVTAKREVDKVAPEQPNKANLNQEMASILSALEQLKRRKTPKFSMSFGFLNKLFQPSSTNTEKDSVKLEPEERLVPAGAGVMQYNPYGENKKSIVHIGCFDNKGRLQGKGIARVPDLGVFHGEFRDGYPHGKGCLYYENGDRYNGSYDHGVGSGDAVFTTNSGRESTADDTIHGLFRNTRFRELDSTSASAKGGPDADKPQKETNRGKDGTADLKDRFAPGFGYDRDMMHYHRVDGGYLTYKQDPWNRGVYNIYRLTSAAGEIECTASEPSRLRTIVRNGGPVDEIARGGRLAGKKKK